MLVEKTGWSGKKKPDNLRGGSTSRNWFDFLQTGLRRSLFAALGFRQGRLLLTFGG